MNHATEHSAQLMLLRTSLEYAVDRQDPQEIGRLSRMIDRITVEKLAAARRSA